MVLALSAMSVLAVGCRGRRGGVRRAPADGGMVAADGGGRDAGPTRDGGGRDGGVGFDAGPRDAGGLDAGPAVDVNGEWLGTWSSVGTVGEAYASLSQSGSTVSGNMTFYDSPCGTEGLVFGTVMGSDFSGMFLLGADTASFTGTAIASPPTITGSFTVESGVCSGITGTFDLTR